MGGGSNDSSKKTLNTNSLGGGSNDSSKKTLSTNSFNNIIEEALSSDTELNMSHKAAIAVANLINMVYDYSDFEIKNQNEPIEGFENVQNYLNLLEPPKNIYADYFGEYWQMTHEGNVNENFIKYTEQTAPMKLESLSASEFAKKQEEMGGLSLQDKKSLTSNTVKMVPLENPQSVKYEFEKEKEEALKLAENAVKVATSASKATAAAAETLQNAVTVLASPKTMSLSPKFAPIQPSKQTKNPKLYPFTQTDLALKKLYKFDLQKEEPQHIYASAAAGGKKKTKKKKKIKKNTRLKKRKLKKRKKKKTKRKKKRKKKKTKRKRKRIK